MQTDIIHLRKVPENKTVKVSVIRVAQFDRAHLMVGYDDGEVRIRNIDDPSIVVFNYNFGQKVKYINFVTGAYGMLIVMLEDHSL